MVEMPRSVILSAGLGDVSWPFFFFMLFLLVFGVVLGYAQRREKRRRQEWLERMRHGGTVAGTPVQEQRGLRRIPIPPGMEVRLEFTDPACFGLAARALDVTSGGLALLPDFPLKRLPLEKEVHNVVVTTPLGEFVIATALPVRLEHQPGVRLLALSIVSMEESQRRSLDHFVRYLEGLTNGTR